jgi:hypothetical protein
MSIHRVTFNSLIPILILFGLQIFDTANAAKKDFGPVTIDYAQTYGVSLEEAQWRLSKEDYAAEITKRIEVASPETFSGSYIEHKPVFQVIVQFVGDAKTQLAKYTLDPLFVPRRAPRALEVLVAAQADIVDQLRRQKIDFTSTIDIKKSEVTLFVKNPAAR